MSEDEGQREPIHPCEVYEWCPYPLACHKAERCIVEGVDGNG